MKNFEKEINRKVKNLSKAKERENRVEQGYFDGRFSHQVVPNKKKYNKKKERQLQFAY